MRSERPTHPEWTDRLSDYLEGDLSVEDHRAVETHLEGCGSCRLVLEELRDIVGRAAELGPLLPPRDLWPGIEATIAAPAPTDDPVRVIAFPHQAARGSLASVDEARRVSFTRGQLLAASVVLVAISSFATWMAGAEFGVVGPAATMTQGSGGAVSMASDVGVAPSGAVGAELASLEQAFAVARSALDPNTVRVLERNLDIIQRAIDDSRRALELDPGNQFLTEHLERAYERKRDYLREAARVAEWVG